MNKAQKIRDSVIAFRMLADELEGLADIMEVEENPNPIEKKDYKKVGKCFLCDKQYKRWGHNPEPLWEFHNRVCDDCNREKVIPARLKTWNTK